jgi:hypothetical protein
MPLTPLKTGSPSLLISSKTSAYGRLFSSELALERNQIHLPIRFASHGFTSNSLVPLILPYLLS